MSAVYFSSATEDLLLELVRRGFKLEMEGDKLAVEGDLTDEIRRRIREHRDDLVTLVRAGEHRWRQVEESEVKRLEIPSQIHPGKVDVWMTARRKDESTTFWFAGSEKRRTE